MKVFIGSSSESRGALDWVAAQIEELGHVPVPWNQPGLFPPGSYVLPKLIEIVHKTDAAIFVFAEDDRVWYREDQLPQTRDNVLLEYGLFVGVLGLDKAIICRSDQPKTASDIKGIIFINVTEGYRQRARLELDQWLKQLAGEPGGIDALSVSTRQAILAILALACRLLTPADKHGTVRALCHGLEGERQRTLRPITNYFPGGPDFDEEILVPCSEEAAKHIRIAEAVLKRGIVKKNVADADRAQWPEPLGAQVRQDIASVIASPLIAKGTVIGTVAFDSCCNLDEMRWNDPGVDEVLRWTSKAIVSVLGAEPSH